MKTSRYIFIIKIPFFDSELTIVNLQYTLKKNCVYRNPEFDCLRFLYILILIITKVGTAKSINTYSLTSLHQIRC